MSPALIVLACLVVGNVLGQPPIIPIDFGAPECVPLGFMDLPTPKEYPTLKSLAVSPDEKKVYVVGQDLHVIDVQNPEVMYEVGKFNCSDPGFSSQCR